MGVFFLSYRPKHFTCIISFNSAVQWDPLFLFLFYKFGNWDLERPPSTKLLNCEAKIWTLTSDTKSCALKLFCYITFGVLIISKVTLTFCCVFPFRDPSILDSLDLNEDEREVLINNINRRLTPQAVKIRAGKSFFKCCLKYFACTRKAIK